MSYIYVIDPTSRQYGFEINESLKLVVNENTYNITEETPQIDVFESAIQEGLIFKLISNKGITLFNPDKVIGIQYVVE
jgi:hypothetical protein